MSDIRIRDLPLTLTPDSSDYVGIDGVVTRRASISDLVNSGAPVASQAESIAGTNNTKRMTPLTVAQAIEASPIGSAMQPSVYDPDGVGNSAFEFANMTDKLLFANLGSDISATSNVLITVGESGAYATLGPAITAASKLVNIPFINGGISVEIRLLAGFTLAEQIIVRSLDLGFITITSVDPVVTVTRDSISTIQLDGRRPTFLADEKAVMPAINCQFQLSAGSLTAVDGIAVANGSSARMKMKAGFRGFFRNVSAYYNSEVSLYEPGLASETSTNVKPDFSGALSSGAYASYTSKINIAGIKLDNSAGVGGFAIWGSSFDFYRGTAKNCIEHGVFIRDRSEANVREFDASGCGGSGFYALHNSSMNARSLAATAGAGKATGCAIGVLAQQASIIEADGIDVSGSTQCGVRAEYGSLVNCRQAVATGSANGFDSRYASIISASSSTATGCSGIGGQSFRASSLDVEGANLSGCGDGVFARYAGTINAQSANLTLCTSSGATANEVSTINLKNSSCRKTTGVDSASDIRTFGGSRIEATGSTGGFNVVKNTISADGTVFKP